MGHVYGAAFKEASSALVILAIAAIIAGTSNPILNFLNAQNRPGASSIISIGSSILTAILLFILVPELSYRGAALATLFGALTILIMRYTYFKHFSNSKYFY